MKFARLADSREAEQSGDGRAEAVLEAVGRLPEKHRLVIMLKHFGGLSYAEISKMTGLSSTTIDGRLRTAKKELKRALTRIGEGVS
jgi:RNA polymerase sigma-70 factor (ECF subfamily)